MEKKGVVIAIDNKQKIFLEGKPLPEGMVRSRISDFMTADPKLQVILRAHRLTPYSMVIRILDDVRMAGVFDVILEAKKKPDRGVK